MLTPPIRSASFSLAASQPAAADVAPQTLVQLGILYGPIVAGFAVVSVWCFTHYKLNRARHREILEELQQMRQARG